jgi:hypothetical protein
MMEREREREAVQLGASNYLLQEQKNITIKLI